MNNQLKYLRKRIRRIETGNRLPRGFSLGHRSADAALPHGLLGGALHEVYAAERHAAAGTGFALMLALRLAAKNLLWVRQDFSSVPCGELSPAGFLELGLDPDRLILVRAPSALRALRAAAEALSCKALGAVLLELWGGSSALDMAASRRLSLSAARSGVSVILLNFSARPRASTAETRWLVEPESSAGEDWGPPVLSATLLRNRHGHTGRFSMEWNCDERIFREPANSRLVASDAAVGKAPPRVETGYRRAG
jgi:protein ImuA